MLDVRGEGVIVREEVLFSADIHVSVCEVCRM